MGNISPIDLKIIVKGAIKMAQQDEKVVSEERGLIKKIIEASKVDPVEFSNIEDPFEDDIIALADQLTSDRSKKIFLLTLFAVAYSDRNFDSSEKQLLDDLSKKLGVGKVKINDDTVQTCEKEVLRLLAAG